MDFSHHRFVHWQFSYPDESHSKIHALSIRILCRKHFFVAVLPYVSPSVGDFFGFVGPCFVTQAELLLLLTSKQGGDAESRANSTVDTEILSKAISSDSNQTSSTLRHCMILFAYFIYLFAFFVFLIMRT